MPPVAGPSTIPPPPPGHIQPPFHVPYYMPPPFAMPPYVPGRMGAPPAMYARDPYAPMYPPPYPYPYPYPPPPPGYAFPPPYHIPMPPSPLAQTSGSPSQTPQPPNQQPPPTQPTATTSTTAPKTPSVTASSPSPPSQPTQTMFNPFNQPLDIASMYSTFSSRPKSDKHAAGTHNNRTPYGAAVTVTVSPQPATPTSAVATSTTIMSPNSELLPPGSSLKLTFNAKTGQTYSRPEPLPGLGPPKRKRSVVDESGQGETSSKRAGACNGGEGGQTNAVAAIQPPVPPASVPGDECAEAPSSRSVSALRFRHIKLSAHFVHHIDM
ncbi:hypothetical protein BXZ70DRAFT_309537 [Cristinia sonorae]|uniref:Uncharacterized protein n=1 Tax=Cristinia sonorae TaxID=1940300 RepID=A0A8K0UKK1_9AGAR|nr:hypothetical protein BXZ70DRAFT_309537 [Cristinia sonorae]